SLAAARTYLDYFPSGTNAQLAGDIIELHTALAQAANWWEKTLPLVTRAEQLTDAAGCRVDSGATPRDLEDLQTQLSAPPAVTDRPAAFVPPYLTETRERLQRLRMAIQKIGECRSVLLVDETVRRAAEAMEQGNYRATAGAIRDALQLADESGQPALTARI